MSKNWTYDDYQQADYKDALEAAMAPSSDEVCCSCCATLRLEVVRLRAVVSCLEEDIEARDMLELKE